MCLREVSSPPAQVLGRLHGQEVRPILIQRRRNPPELLLPESSLTVLARERASGQDLGRVQWRVGDMLDAGLGCFDHVVAMDSLIHYRAGDIVEAVAGLRARTHGTVLFTVAPRTPLLAAMHAIGTLFPKSDRAPAIEPVADRRLRRLIAEAPGLASARIARSQRIASGFYTSQAMELVCR